MFENRIWDYTSLETFLKCRKKFYFMVVKGLRPVTVSPALIFGQVVHSALDKYYTEGIESALRTFRETYKDIEGEELRTQANGIKLISKYAEVYKNEPFKVVGKPEIGFVFPIGDILWGGRMDLPVEWGSDLWVVEHKTTSILRSSYFQQFEMDFQITSYTVGAEEYMGRKCQGCVINALEPWKELKRPTYRSKKPEDHFQRCPITRSTATKDKFKLNVQRVVRDIKWCADNDEWYESHHKDICFSYNYNCPYKVLCQHGEDERFIKRDFRYEPWEPYKQEDTNENNTEGKDGLGDDKGGVPEVKEAV